MSRPQAHVVASAASATPTEGRRLMSTSIAERRPSWSSTAAALSPTSPRCSGSPAKVSPTGWIPPPTPTTRPPWPMPTARGGPACGTRRRTTGCDPCSPLPLGTSACRTWAGRCPSSGRPWTTAWAEGCPAGPSAGARTPGLRLEAGPRYVLAPDPERRVLARWVPESGMRDFRDAHPPASWRDTCPLTDLPKCATMGWNRGGVRCRASLSREGFARAVPPPTPPAPLSPLPGGRDADGKCVALALGGDWRPREPRSRRGQVRETRHDGHHCKCGSRCRGASCCCCASDDARDQPPAPVRPTWVESSTGPCLSAAPCARRADDAVADRPGPGRVACPRLRGHVRKPWPTWTCPRRRGHATRDRPPPRYRSPNISLDR